MDEAEDGESFVYDEVAYPTPVLAVQTPDVLGAALLMHGLRAPPPETASVLEIGCGNGYNLIGIAAAWPETRCVGFDLSASAIADGNRLIAQAGLTNIELVHGDILTWPRDRTFDYITCHGVYTWVPGNVRDATMELVGKVLAPGGVAYIGYDSLPASATKAAINRFLIRHVSHIRDIPSRVDAAVELVGVLSRHQLEPSRLRPQMEALVKDAPNYPRAYFFHDWLAPFYNPVSIEDFAADAARNGLRFAGDSALHDLYEGNVDADARALLERAGSDPVERNMTLDILRGSHMFRGDMLVRRDPPHPEEPDALSRLYFAFGGLRTETDKGSVKYSRLEKIFTTTEDPVHQKLLDSLERIFPLEMNLDELLAETGLEQYEARAALNKFVVMGLVDVHTTKTPFVSEPGERPRASALVRAMIQHSPNAIGLRHMKFQSDQEPTRLMLVLADGTRTRAEIARDMGVQLGADIPVDKVEVAIAEFARQALFEA